MSGSPAHHNLYAYYEDGALVDHAAPFLSEGLREHEATVLVVDTRKRALLREALGEQLDRVRCIDRDTFYTRPEDVLASYDALVRRYLRDGVARVRVFGELPRCRSQRDSDTWILYEALINPAFAHHPVTIVCGLDVREQPISVIEGSWQTHPRALSEGWSDNERYQPPRETVRARAPAPLEAPGLTAVDAGLDRRELRRQLLAEMAAADLAKVDAVNMLTAVEEVLSNARRYGGGVRAIRTGRVGERFVCEISDHGPGLDDPLAGYLPPRPGHEDGAGLWIARQMTRRLEMTSSSRGLTTRLWT